MARTAYFGKIYKKFNSTLQLIIQAGANMI